MKRNLSRMFRTGVAAAAALLCAMPFQAAAEDYPSRPITLIMPCLLYTSDAADE